MKLWDIDAKREVRTFTHRGVVFSLAFSPDGRMLPAATKDKVVKVWSTADGREQRALIGSWVALGPDGQLAVAADDTVTLYDSVSWNVVRTLRHTSTAPSQPLSLAINPSGRLAATSNTDGKVVVWDRNGSKAAPRNFWLHHPRQAEGQLAFTPEGRYLISANANGKTYVLRPTPMPEK